MEVHLNDLLAAIGLDMILNTFVSVNFAVRRWIGVNKTMEEAFLDSAIQEVEDAIIRDFEKLRLNSYDLDMERERNERGRYSALLEDAQNIEFSIEKLIAIRKMLQDQI